MEEWKKGNGNDTNQGGGGGEKAKDGFRELGKRKREDAQHNTTRPADWPRSLCSAEMGHEFGKRGKSHGIDLPPSNSAGFSSKQKQQ
jgi:hypothetical protein